jgi:hypothetical protein
MKKVHLYAFLLFGVFLVVENTRAQSMVDVSVGTSHQDNFFGNIAYRYQVNEKFRIGLETQFGSVNYRLIGAKVIKKGYVNSTSVPLTLRLYEKERVRLDFYSRLGARFQGVLDPDGNDKRDSLLNSTALIFEPGLLVTVQLNAQLNLQSGFSFPTYFEVQPTVLYENTYVPVLHLALNHKIGAKNILFLKTAFGAAVGGDGDTQKFGQSVQAGFRFNFGSQENPSFVEPSF